MSDQSINVKEALEKLIVDITQHDLNRQIQHLITEFKRTGDDNYRLDAEFLRSEFDSWWDEESALFVPPAEDV